MPIAPVFFDGRPTITPPTPRELEARRERGETLSDWTKVATRPRPEAHASLRLDAGMLDWFKSQGRGNQTKINAILRSYFQQHGRQEIRASRRR